MRDDQAQRLSEAGKELSLALLDAMDQVCSSIGVDYMLDCGSLLGAVREHGFIAWDDDIDILIRRDDYEALRDNGRWPAPVALSDPADRWDAIPRVQLVASSSGPRRQPVQLDLFVADPAPDGAAVRAIWVLGAKAIINLHAAGQKTFAEWRDTSASGGRRERLKGVAYGSTSAASRRIGTRRWDNALRAWNRWGAARSSGSIWRVNTRGRHYPGVVAGEFLGSCQIVTFEGRQVPAPNPADQYLRLMYGPDFMTPKRGSQWRQHQLTPFWARLGDKEWLIS